ncbi:MULTISPECIES: ABC-type transport auxiliary lipoprotein family protein [Phenylobacterium]|uniref:Cholesterol transport system auxiliary component n=1 Tax=Phenylobacterium koreense TaxID=266125 RepID=A0ABV2EDF1_9CAUL
MRAIRRVLQSLALAATAVGLSACISLLPEEDPSQLYRFDGVPAADAQQAAATDSFGVLRTGGGFVQSASGDRIMTVTGERVAFISGARWVSPASVLFNDAVMRAFDQNTGPARLVTRGEVRRAEYGLRIDVTRFEVVYDQGEKAAPNIVVALRLSLVNMADRTLAGSKLVETTARADDNRVSAIVRAFDEAVAQVTGQTVAWTNGRGA